jgi:hypothetical protein
MLLGIYLASSKLFQNTNDAGSMKIYFIPHRQKLKSLQLKVEQLHPEQQKK